MQLSSRAGQEMSTGKSRDRLQSLNAEKWVLEMNSTVEVEPKSRQLQNENG